ncbi:unnamed protein product [Nyctereutes procyonoides]|uniref:(raccoon dog) hypothetical protein n=1 Tax=Nyctereutes procyonoides TaxID=34880 RepID=A0A811YR49_NYCPR|nr:unnamed protein product [Nyctereutes procyonoides]
MATKAPCCLGDGSRVLEPIPSIQSEGGCEGAAQGDRRGDPEGQVLRTGSQAAGASDHHLLPAPWTGATPPPRPSARAWRGERRRGCGEAPRELRASARKAKERRAQGTNMHLEGAPVMPALAKAPGWDPPRGRRGWDGTRGRLACQGSRAAHSLNDWPFLFSAADGRGRPQAPPASRSPRVTQHPHRCTTPTSRPRSKEPQVHPERQSPGRRRADAKSQPSCRPPVLPHLLAPPGCSARAPTAAGGGQRCPGWEQRQTWGRGGAHGCPELPLLSGTPGRRRAHPPSARQVPALKLDTRPSGGRAAPGWELLPPSAGAKGWPLPAHQVSRGGAKRKAGTGVVLRDTRWTTGGEQAASAPRSILCATFPPSRNMSASPCAPTPAHPAWASAQEPWAPTRGRDSTNLGLTRVEGAGGWAAGWEDWLLGERWCDTWVTVGAGGRSWSPHAENLPLTCQPRAPPIRQVTLVQENQATQKAHI